MEKVELDKIEAIYINPKWKMSKVGEFLTFNKKKKNRDKDPNNLETLTQMKASSKFDSQRDKVDFKIKPNSREHLQSDSSDDDTKQPSESSGVTIEDFEKLIIPDKVMKDGMLFIWVEKEYIMRIVRHLETQNFFYVENVCYVMLDRNMEKGKRFILAI